LFNGNDDPIGRWRFRFPSISCCFRVSFGGALPVFFAWRFASQIATISFACARVRSRLPDWPFRRPIAAKYSRTSAGRRILSALTAVS
jgi:hypothetical protein